MSAKATPLSATEKARANKIAGGTKKLLTALGPEATAILTVEGSGYDLRIRFQDAADIAAEVLRLQSEKKDLLVFSGVKPKRRARAPKTKE